MVLNDAKIHFFYPLVQGESKLISIFMIIQENIRYHRKITAKIKGVKLQDH